MTPVEWGKIADRIKAFWPHSNIPIATIDAWYDLLSDLPGEHVLVAVIVLGRSSREFAPPAGVIRSKVVELSEDAPDWGSAWAEILDCVDSLGYTAQLEDGRLVRDDGHSHEWSHPLVERLVRMLGWKEICTFDLSDLRTIEAQSRNKYSALVERDRQDRTYAGLPSGGLKRLQNMERLFPESKTALTEARLLLEAKS